MIVRKTYVCILVLSTFFALGQRNSEKGDKYFYQNQFTDAIKYYQLDAKLKNKKVAEHAMLRLADCYRITGEFELAEKAYQKFLKKFRKNPLSYLNYGLSLKASAKYAEAKVQFEEYIKMNPTDQMGPVYLQSCDSAQKWLDETLGKEVKNISQLNTNESEFSPVILEDKIYFSSSREGSKSALISFDGGGNINRMDIYSINYSHLLKSEIPKKGITNVKGVNTPAHEGSPTFSADGKEMYFARTLKGKRDKKTNDIVSTLQVFYSKKDSLGNWSLPISAFEFNSAQYSIAQPSLSRDGKVIYFMSDMPGGFGKTDIYYSVKDKDNKWTKPKNAGSKVNTFSHELFPHISSDNTLYFSSSGHPGMGQLDIFRATYNDNAWQNVENLKPPFNSIGSDFGICFDESNGRGFFSSDRFNGAGGEDIYSFSNDKPVNYILTKDSIQLFNSLVYDDVKYKLENKTDSSGIELDLSKPMIAFKLENNKSYLLTAKKNGMPINKIEIKKQLDTIANSLQFSILSESLDVTFSYRIGGEKTQLFISDVNGAELETTDELENGTLTPKIVLKPSENYIFYPISNAINRELKNKKISN